MKKHHRRDEIIGRKKIMTFVTAALIVGGTSLVSGYMGSKAAQSGAQAQAGATSQAAELQRQTALDSIAFQKEMFQKQLELGQPYRETG